MNSGSGGQKDRQAMCGRFTQMMSWSELQALYRTPGSATPLNLRPRFNGCPTQDFAVCRLDSASGRSIAKLRWGLVPTWAKDARTGSRLINARSETVHEKPSFRSAFRRRRCVIPANGWLEWRREGDRKQPWFITSPTRDPFSFAGLQWNNSDRLSLEFQKAADSTFFLMRPGPLPQSG